MAVLDPGQANAYACSVIGETIRFSCVTVPCPEDYPICHTPGDFCVAPYS